MKNKYINVHLEVKEEHQDICLPFLDELDFTGIEQNDDELIISFLHSKYNKNQLLDIIDKLINIDIHMKIIKEIYIDDKNWNEEYEKQSKPIIINNKISITPEWRKNEVNSEIKILINPKMSFGTGEHSTTKLMCRLMDGIISKGSKWVDVGTGTGVLAILASKLGADRVFAFDNNEWSVDNALENIKLNNEEENIDVQQKDIDDYIFPKCNGIMANLFFHLVNKSLDRFYNTLKYNQNDLLISGIMKYDSDKLIDNAYYKGFELINIIDDNEWIACHFKPKGNL